MGWTTLDFSHAPVHASNCAMPSQNKSTWENMSSWDRMRVASNTKSYPEADKSQVHEFSEKIVWKRKEIHEEIMAKLAANNDEQGVPWAMEDEVNRVFWTQLAVVEDKL
uniref:Uncharacterized protein n=1 Tax=Pyramimonas obovata TaxID=1411642 RepID=A0A7S0R854_9CHLO|mmetsp:Transcript_27777/g.60730  ORF Transcript_27777/g.60730 Transcript_27777/m.60730 type:complete len:109 (+) Transcript_27777:103-429(+)|eukprot:CAMPEP_0118958668 /NCGR_PEP_ID=MMETSP1169-20130426/62743_1 /TAXON_ID=36882 /ORGANISM="Pyramimonas obovata, Strain CCMP722" /LENGTH=108 /DNA_ID=CAMNT_0006906793 /DNA_START=103 /DNA_END=429 /DNA_ORIENTATION=+